MSGLQSDMAAIITAVLLLFLALSPVAGRLRCYKCTDNGPETECELSITEQPPNEVIQQCKQAQKYCVIRRVEKTRFPGRVSSIARNCETDPPIKNDVDVGTEDTTYFVSCQTDLCNDGDGTTTVVVVKPNEGKPPMPPWEKVNYDLGYNSRSSHVTASLTSVVAVMIIWILHHITLHN